MIIAGNLYNNIFKIIFNFKQLYFKVRNRTLVVRLRTNKITEQKHYALISCKIHISA